MSMDSTQRNDNIYEIIGSDVRVDASDELGGDFLALKESGQLLDVTLECEDGQTIDAHRLVLSARIDLFRAMFTSGMAEASKHVISMKGLSGKQII